MTETFESQTQQNDATVLRAPVNTPRALRKYLSLDDFEHAARRHLPKAVYGYVAGGVETDTSLRANREAFSRWSFVPRTLRDTSQRTARKSILGMECALPFGIAPMGFSALAGYDGDVALARGATAAGTFAISSAASFTPLERMAGEGGSTWFQAYLPGDDTRIAALVKRLRNAQYDVLVVTADVPVPGNRENNARNGFDAPFRVTPSLIWQGATHPRWVLGTLGRELLKRGMPHFENMEAIQGPPLFSRKLVRSMIARDRLNWDNIALIRRLWPGKLVLKGILSPEDAELAAAHGADGIIVSNHGGRQLDGAVDPLKMLPTVKSQAGDMAVMMDCGIRRGSDVLKALALGADFVFVGRPFLFAAAVAGEVGVHHAAKILEEEVLRNMAMLGITDLAHLSADQHLVYATS